MTNLPLPSGRIVEIRDDILYGEFVKVSAAGLHDPEAFLYARFAAFVPSLSRIDIENLSREDGIALAAEVNRRWNGRPEEKEIPFGRDSQPSSAASSPPTPNQ